MDLALQGFAGFRYFVEGSTNLRDWFAVTSFINSSEVMYWRDTAAGNTGQRFYRAFAP